MIESLKTDKEIKGLQKYVGEHILLVMEVVEDQTIVKVLEILTLKYGRTRVEMVEDFMDDWLKFKDDNYVDDAELLLGLKELNQRRKELKITEEEWVAVWMLNVIKKKKRLDKFVYQSLKDVVKAGGDNVVKNFKEKFKELWVEGHQKESNYSILEMFSEEDKYMDEDDVEMEEEEDLDASEGDLDSQGEIEEKEMYLMGTLSQTKKNK